VTYRDRQRLADIQAAIDAIRSHLQRGDLSDGPIFDAVRIRLLEIGEAVKALPDDLLATQPSIPWRQIAACATTSHTATSTPPMRSCRPRQHLFTTHGAKPLPPDRGLPGVEGR
jgi:hypothetical protein